MRFAPWIARVVLAMASLIFTAIGLRYILDPAGASAKTGVSLNTALGHSVTRVGFGAFPLAFAIFSFTCLISYRRLYEGVRLIATLAATVIVVRLYSTVTDGFAKDSVILFVPELVLLALAVTAALLDPRGRRAALGHLRRPDQVGSPLPAPRRSESPGTKTIDRAAAGRAGL
jgi:hypothetical protein